MKDIRLTPNENGKAMLLSPASARYHQVWKVLKSNHDEYFALFNLGHKKVLTYENETSTKLSGTFF